MRFKTNLILAMLAVGLTTAVEARAALPEGCGNDSVQYKVKTGKKGQPLPVPEPGKAQIVVFESVDSSIFPAPTARFGVDGTWMGAGHGVSYVVLSVMPGSHKLCASRQSSAVAEKGDVGIATVDTDAGKTYFFQYKIALKTIGTVSRPAGGGVPGHYTSEMTAKDGETADFATFNALTADEAKAVMKGSAIATGTPK